MAISSYKAFLMQNTGTALSPTWAKVIDIKSFPNLGGAPEQLETTTLSDSMTTYIKGIQKLDALTFSANYDKANFTTLKTLEGLQKEYSVWLGGTGEGATLTPTGTDGKFTFKGELAVYPKGGGVNSVVEMEITILPSTIIAFA